MHRPTHQLVSALLAIALVGGAAPARAQSRTVVIDQLDDGTVFDGIIDGFPNLAPKDGNPDFGGNPLSVALKTDVTELRSVMEFPLDELADVLPEDVLAATLTFNVDDVLSTFGPGTDFSGSAADTIFVHPYDGDGTAAVGDYLNRGEPAWEVDTGPGAITDTTLNTTGAVYFEIDVRDRLRAAITAGTPFLGFLWRTNDSPTGTSIDDLGEGASGPPGARGSSMPFLTIEVEEPPPPPNCGNGELNAGETCDDGNNEDGDCCNRNCQLDAAGTECSDGNACTEGDTCNAGGICQTGAPLDCNDGEFCTTDSCDAATGCVNLAAHEGEPCDDQNVCTMTDVCGGGSCRGVPVPVGGCDDGDECTVSDTCSDGVCVGEALCGNGRLDATPAACAEECDDGNTASLDGCSDVCTYDSVLGGKGKKECLLQIAFDAPVRDEKGDVAKVQRCTDGAPCDHQPEPNVCGFVLAACLGQADPRLPECAAAPLSALSLKKPGRKDATNRTRFEEVLAKTAFPGCTEPIQVDVKVKGAKNPNSLLAPGKMKVVLATKAPGIGRDADKVTLICDPAP
jgi:cysteine-rich repeat protein